MSTGLDMSLDDLIKQSKSRPKTSSASASGPTRRSTPAARAMPYPPVVPKAAASPYGVFSEHVAAMAVSPPAPHAATRALETGTKLHISNLNASVTVEDVQELFSEVGDLKRYSVNYDKDGKSQGTAEVVFARKVDALDAIERYNGVLLDGKPMKIELIGNNAEPPPTTPLMYNHAIPNYNAIPNSVPQRGGPRGPFHGNGRPGNSSHGGGGPRGIFQGSARPGSSFQGSGGPRGTFQGNGRAGSSGQGNGGRGQGRAWGHDRNRVQASAADLDAELEQYHAEAVMKK